jgi:hypothetical protein
MAELLDLLMRGGPWTLLLAAGFTIRFLFIEMRRRDLEHAAQTQALNDRIVASVEKQIPLLQASNEQSRKLVDALTRMEEQHR